MLSQRDKNNIRSAVISATEDRINELTYYSLIYDYKFFELDEDNYEEAKEYLDKIIKKCVY